MDVMNLLPELLVFLGALVILMFDVFFGKKMKDQSRISLIASVVLICGALFVVFNDYGVISTSFCIGECNMTNGKLFYMFIINEFTSFAKIVILLLLLAVVIVSQGFLSAEKKISSEFIALCMIATTGSMILISSSDFLPFYLALELQSLALYVIASIKRDSNKSSESGMKYFLLGSVSSGILLLGISFIYGFTGTTNFGAILELMNEYGMSSGEITSFQFPIGLLFGLILVFVAILFKISAAPFHMWAPDVYEGAPTNITAFFASAIKFAMVFVTIKIYLFIIASWTDFSQIMLLVSVLSLVVGCFGALKQDNLKRMLAYSGVGHIGFISAGLAAVVKLDIVGISAIKSVILYSVIYATLSIGAFALLILLVNKKKLANEDENNDALYKLSSLSGISKTNPFIALCLAILMFSMAGIPPMAGFFAKFYIILAVLKQKLYFLAIIAVMASVVSAFYYLRIVKIMYFDNKEDNNIGINSSSSVSFILFLSALINLLAVLYIEPFLSVINGLF